MLRNDRPLDKANTQGPVIPFSDYCLSTVLDAVAA